MNKKTKILVIIKINSYTGIFMAVYCNRHNPCFWSDEKLNFCTELLVKLFKVDVPSPKLWFSGDKMFAVFSYSSVEFSTYPSATELDFHPPNRFNCKTSQPLLANDVAAVRLKQCPVYAPKFTSFRNSAIFWEIVQ